MKTLAAALLALSTATVAAPKDPVIGYYETPTYHGPAVDDFTVDTKEPEPGRYSGWFHSRRSNFQVVGKFICSERRTVATPYNGFAQEANICFRTKLPMNRKVSDAGIVFYTTYEYVDEYGTEGFAVVAREEKTTTPIVRKPLPASQK